MNQAVRLYMAELGSRKSGRKAESSRRNGRLGGRPRADGDQNLTVGFSRAGSAPLLKPSGKLV